MSDCLYIFQNSCPLSPLSIPCPQPDFVKRKEFLDFLINRHSFPDTLKRQWTISFSHFLDDEIKDHENKGTRPSNIWYLGE